MIERNIHLTNNDFNIIQRTRSGNIDIVHIPGPLPARVCTYLASSLIKHHCSLLELTDVLFQVLKLSLHFSKL